MLFRCICEEPPFSYLNYVSNDLGFDYAGAELSMHTYKRFSKTGLNI